MNRYAQNQEDVMKKKHQQVKSIHHETLQEWEARHARLKAHLSQDEYDKIIAFEVEKQEVEKQVIVIQHPVIKHRTQLEKQVRWLEHAVEHFNWEYMRI